MARPTKRFGGNGLRVVFVFVALLTVASIILLILIVVGPNFKPKSSSPRASCPCHCDCFEDLAFPFPLESINNSYADCGRNDPEMQEELKKNIVDLLREEIDLQKLVVNDSLERSKQALTRAKLFSNHHQKEAKKCKTQLHGCEAKREMAEADLIKEVKLTRLWKKRARELGWNNTFH